MNGRIDSKMVTVLLHSVTDVGFLFFLHVFSTMKTYELIMVGGSICF